MKPRVYDCFLVSEGEEDLVEIRVRTLWDVVDVFVSVEGDRYFNGQPKDQTAVRIAMERLNWADGKLVPFSVDLAENPQPWQNETFQREMTFHSAKSCGMEVGDIFVLSDVDEIPNPQTARQAIEICQSAGPVRLTQEMRYLYLDNRLVGKEWTDGPIFCLAGHMRTGPDNVRRSWWPSLRNGGWHFQYIGGPDRFITKMKTGSHADPSEPCCDDVPEMTDSERVAAAYLNPDVDLFKDHHKRQVTFERVPLTEEFMPKCVVENPNRWANLLFQRCQVAGNV